MACTRLWLALTMMLVFAINLAACENGSGDEPEAQFAAQVRDDSWCTGPNQKVEGKTGYCVCTEANKKYNDATGDCSDCMPSCAGKACGDDGCGGPCGESCAAGEVCVEHQCAVCEPDCTDKMCGDDGCGGSCGQCPVVDPNEITACTCLNAPIGAYPGATRYEQRCSSGFAQFSLCEQSCGHSGVAWKESCVDGLPCGTALVGCNCGYPPAGAYPGAVGQAEQCETGFAQFVTCNFYCSPQTVAWAFVCSC